MESKSRFPIILSIFSCKLKSCWRCCCCCWCSSCRLLWFIHVQLMCICIKCTYTHCMRVLRKFAYELVILHFAAASWITVVYTELYVCTCFPVICWDGFWSVRLFVIYADAVCHRRSQQSGMALNSHNVHGENKCGGIVGKNTSTPRQPYLWVVMLCTSGRIWESQFYMKSQQKNIVFCSDFPSAGDTQER